MVYQEQVMRILNELGGIELAAAYTCIKAISKKKEETIAKNREQFLEGRAGQWHLEAAGRRFLEPDHQVRGLRLQQVALHRLRPDRLHDGLSQGPLPGRVHGGAALGRYPGPQLSRRRTRSSSTWKIASGWASTSCRPT